MKRIFIGIIIGIVLTFSTTVFSETVKEYILKKVSYPILVNGIEYIDEELPALNYEGNTYVPLRAVGDILGVGVRWNDELNRAEIDNVIEEQMPINKPVEENSSDSNEKNDINKYEFQELPISIEKNGVEIIFKSIALEDTQTNIDVKIINSTENDIILNISSNVGDHETENRNSYMIGTISYYSPLRNRSRNNFLFNKKVSKESAIEGVYEIGKLKEGTENLSVSLQVNFGGLVDYDSFRFYIDTKTITPE